MRLLRLITFISYAFFVFLFSGCSENSKKATNTGKCFLENMYTCNFKACDALCTDDGREVVRWFASNLTDEDLALISNEVKIEVEESEITKDYASIVYTAKNVIICDSLETNGHIGNRSLKMILKNINGTWKVDRLEW